MPHDETITSFADRIIELFEMINEEKGGKKTIINQKLFYEISMENPAPVRKIISLENQKRQTKTELKETILSYIILSSNREENARGAYMAICFDMAEDMKKKYPHQWKAACFNLSGYWKIMANIFQGDGKTPFTNLARFEEKFKAAGFKSLAKKYTDKELYEETIVWKNPAELY